MHIMHAGIGFLELTVKCTNKVILSTSNDVN